jgi:hypothetical protein
MVYDGYDMVSEEAVHEAHTRRQPIVPMARYAGGGLSGLYRTDPSEGAERS